MKTCELTPAYEYNRGSTLGHGQRVSTSGAWRMEGTPLVVVAEFADADCQERDLSRWVVRVDCCRTVPERRAWEQWVEDKGFGSIGASGTIYKTRRAAADAALDALSVGETPMSLPLHTEPQDQHRHLYENNGLDVLSTIL